MDFIKTGRNAQRSLQDRWTREQAKPAAARDEDVAFPVNARAQRRARERNLDRQMRKGQRKFVQRELIRERIAGDLAYQVAIVDGNEPSRPLVYHRVVGLLAGKAATLVHQDAERYNKEFDAWVRNGKTGEKPKRPLRHEEAKKQLRELAAKGA